MYSFFVTQEGSTGSLDPSEQFEMIASGQSFDKTPETEVMAIKHKELVQYVWMCNMFDIHSLERLMFASINDS